MHGSCGIFMDYFIKKKYFMIWFPQEKWKVCSSGTANTVMTCVPGVETEAASLFLPFVYMLTVCIFKIVLTSTCNKQNKRRTQKSETFVWFMIKLLFISKTTTSYALFHCQKSSFIRSRRVRTPISQTSLYMQNRPINVALIFFSSSFQFIANI